MDNLGACFIELPTVVENELNIALELVLADIGATSHFRHDGGDIHRLRNHGAVLLVHGVIAESVWVHRMQEICRLVVVIEFSKDEPALLHIDIVEFFLCERVIDRIVASSFSFLINVLLILL